MGTLPNVFEVTYMVFDPKIEFKKDSQEDLNRVKGNIKTADVLLTILAILICMFLLSRIFLI